MLLGKRRIFQSPQVQFGPTILQRLWEVNKGNAMDQDVAQSSLSGSRQVASMLSILVNWPAWRFDFLSFGSDRKFFKSACRFSDGRFVVNMSGFI
ncbi:hypothetical protein [Rhizobium lusitanum]|uniref:hypothetical protein n=2 Tax=Rhizobium/Agrobacterium group TaxID=227290 RepID=UPI000DD5594D|nr:hypothetical protein [Rhizobium lusitanum]NTJ07912.1 hypothetical protein [Rhizobium lusitanum]